MRLAICICSRGVGHYRTIAGVIREVEAAGVEPVWCWALGLPIPDAQNEVARQALSEGADALWFVEDDHLLPVGVLRALLAHDAPVVAAGYQLRGGTPCVIKDGAGIVQLVGLGCTLIRAEVFARIPDPPFQTGTRWTWKGGQWVDTGLPEHAGGQDVFFCRNVRAAGMGIAVLDGWEVGHLETVRVGDHVNWGMDEIKLWGGRGDLPWRPPATRREAMGERVFLKLAGGHVIDMDPAHKNYERYIKAGAVVIKASEAQPALKKQAKDDETRASAVDTD